MEQGDGPTKMWKIVKMFVDFQGLLGIAAQSVLLL